MGYPSPANDSALVSSSTSSTSIATAIEVRLAFPGPRSVVASGVLQSAAYPLDVHEPPDVPRCASETFEMDEPDRLGTAAREPESDLGQRRTGDRLALGRAVRLDRDGV